VIRPGGGAPPPISTPLSSVASARQLASGVGSAATSQQRGVPGSGRGIFVSIEAAVITAVAVLVGAVFVFFLGVNVARKEQSLSGGGKTEGTGKGGSARTGDDGIPSGNPDEVKPINVGRRPRPRPGTGPRQGPKPPPVGKGKYSIEVMRFPLNAKGTAEAWQRKLARASVPGAFVVKRRVRGRTEWCVQVGRFRTRDDPAALRLKEQIISVDRRTLTNKVEIVELDDG
jgi:hypothetical protein